MFGGKAAKEKCGSVQENVPCHEDGHDETKDSSSKTHDSDDEDYNKQPGDDNPEKEVEVANTTESNKGTTNSWWTTATSAYRLFSGSLESSPDMANLDAKTFASAAAAQGVDVKDLSGHAETLSATAAAKGVDVKDLAKNADKDQLIQALAAEQDASGLLSKALSLKDKAMKAMNPQERQRMLQESYDSEVQAKGQSAMARRMQSGLWQGGLGGAGVGGGVGAGVGTVVGTLVGGVVALPTTALGGLVGAGVGGVTGPFVKLDQTMAKAVDGKMKEAEAKAKKEGKSKEEIEKLKKEAAKSVVGKDLEKVREAEAKKQAEAKKEAEAKKGGAPEKDANGKAGSMPEKSTEAQEASNEAPKPTKKKPRKLEVRSKAA